MHKIFGGVSYEERKNIEDGLNSRKSINKIAKEEGIAEAFDGKLNIRAAFLPDPGYYWVSMDFNAEELRIPTLITKEPVWLDAFSHGKDIHKQTAIAIWGEENYSKAKRKIAKSDWQGYVSLSAEENRECNQRDMPQIICKFH